MLFLNKISFSHKNPLGSSNGRHLRTFSSRTTITNIGVGFSFCSMGIFNNPATAAMEGIVDFHHFLYFFLFMIIVLISWFLYRIVKTYTLEDTLNSEGVHMRYLRNQPIENPMLEIIWTVLPALILVIISIPSFTLLYSTSDLVNPLITVKVIGHQWYWVYEYSDPVLYTTVDERK
jgi:heme/copper-type cytochrome/quinol oxidase subunit 2